jgi:signal recognition particle GTPase
LTDEKIGLALRLIRLELLVADVIFFFLKDMIEQI